MAIFGFGSFQALRHLVAIRRLVSVPELHGPTRWLLIGIFGGRLSLLRVIQLRRARRCALSGSVGVAILVQR